MKKLIFGFFLLTVFLTVGCKERDTSELDFDEIANKVVEAISLPNQTTEDLVFHSTYEIDNVIVNVTWQPSNLAVITAQGKITRLTIDQEVNLSITISLNEKSVIKDLGTVKVLAYTPQEINNLVKSYLILPQSVSQNLSFPQTINLLGENKNITWLPSNLTIIDSEGKITQGIVDQDVNIIISIEINNTPTQIDLGTVKVLSYTSQQISDYVKANIELPTSVVEDIDFVQTINIFGENFDILWQPKDLRFIDTDGKITRGLDDQNVMISIIIEVNSTNIEIELGYVKVLAYTDSEILDFFKANIDIPTNVTEDLFFPQTLNILGEIATLTWESSNKDVISDLGIVAFKMNERTTDIIASIEFMNRAYQLNWDVITVSALTPTEYLNYIIAQVYIPDSTMTNITLPTRIDDAFIQWSTSNRFALTADGRWLFNLEDIDVVLDAIFYVPGTIVPQSYNVKVLTIPHQQRLELVDDINLPEYASTNLELPTSFLYGVTGTWSSSLPSILNNNGIIYLTIEEHVVTLTLTLTSGDKTMEKEYTVTTTTIAEGETFNNNHMLVQRIEDFELSSMHNLIVENDRLVLELSAINGYYESGIFKTFEFKSLVGSWAALSSQNATCELEIKVRVNGVWSSYLSYKQWGLGLQNAQVNHDGGVARMSADEILIKNTQLADAFQYKITLRRTSLAYASPKLSLVGVALDFNNYTFKVDVSGLPNFIDYDVPKLYQHDVPSIGNIICSVASSAMLLMYKGHTFTNPLPHAQLSPLLKDYGNNIYGNWVYNTVGMSAYGENSYVKRIYSFEELQHHLVTVGPVALSIKGNTGVYTTNGHLIVVRGYDITPTGTFVITNDPNINGVYYRFPLATFLTFTRNVIYVVE